MVVSTRRPNDLLPPEHEARPIWRYVGGTLNLHPLLARILAVEGGRRCNAADPRLLIAPWLSATLEGVGSARQLARLCECHDAFRWLAGGDSLKHHNLSGLRVRHAAFLDELLTR